MAVIERALSMEEYLVLIGLSRGSELSIYKSNVGSNELGLGFRG